MGKTAYYTTLWYKPNEISSRIGVTYLAGPASGKKIALKFYIDQIGLTEFYVKVRLED